MRPSLVKTSLTALLLLAAQMQTSSAQDTQAAPERKSSYIKKQLVRANKQMVVTANPHASEAGRTILRAGGSAVDAAIAAQMVLNLVEPQSSGIGGGAFLLHWDNAAKKLKTYDGRETAPASAKPDRFLNEDGSRKKFSKASFGGPAVGTPGLVAMLALAHKQHGKLPWKQLFTPAIKRAQDGFPISPRLHKLLAAAKASSFGPTARNYFYDAKGTPHPVGHLLKNPALAETLRQIAHNGPEAFYEGKIATKIIAKLSYKETVKGDLTRQDLKNYKAVERAPVCVGYRNYKVCGMGPPSSGALTVGQVMKLLEPFDLGTKPMNTAALHLIAETQKLAFADRARYMADSDFVSIPNGLLDKGYLNERRTLISRNKATLKAEPGTPPHVKKSQFGRDYTIENNGTSHLSIVDQDGNAISMTTTIESAFGANIMTGGFLLNNELTDFSFLPEDKNGNPIANRIEPGKRPRSSMAPTMVFDADGKLKMITGSPGGSRIIPYVIKTLIGHIDWQLDAQDAASLTNFGSRNGPFEVEKNTLSQSTKQELKKLGHKIREVDMTSGSHIIIINDDGLEGGADPRREGLALGD